MMNNKTLKYILPITLLLLILGAVVFLVNNGGDSDNNSNNIHQTSGKISDNKDFEDNTALLLSSDNEDLLDAVKAMNSGDSESAISGFEQLMGGGEFSESELKSLKSLLVHSYLAYGSTYYSESDNAQKARNLLESSGISHDTWFYNYYTGYSYEIENNFDQALTYYNEALRFGDIVRKAQTLNQIGHTYDLLGDLEQAQSYYQKAYNKNPENIQVNLNLGRVYARQGDASSAKRYFEAIVDKVEDVFLKAEIYFNLSSIYLYGSGDQDDNFQKSIDYAQKAVDTNARYPFGYVGVARVLISMGVEYDQAETYLADAIELYPNLTQAHRWLATAYLYQGKLEKASDAFDRAISLIDTNITLMESQKSQQLGILYYGKAQSNALLKDTDKTIDALQNTFANPDPISILSFGTEIELSDYGIYNFLKGNQWFEEIVDNYNSL